ncbi:FadR/GntR family transcriptional regulator [Crossiella sp. NPDC003009]
MRRTQELVEQLTARIREGVIRPGEKLPTEGSLVQTYGVSRTVVREALSQLQAAGLVETKHGRGSFVLAQPSTARFEPPRDGELTVEGVVELIEFRIGWESESAALAAQRRTEAQLRDLGAALTEFTAAAANPSAAVNADFQFHLRIALASGNRYFADLATASGPGMIVIPHYRLFPDEQRFGRIVSEHENIHAAIALGDSEGARAAMRVHLSNSRSRLLDLQGF